MKNTLSGRTVPRLLAAAVMFVLSTHVPLQAQQRSSEGVQVVLAPPLKGAVWSDKASLIELRLSERNLVPGFSEEPLNGFPAEFPLVVPPDTYDIFVDGVLHHQAEITRDHVLDISDWRAPRHAWRSPDEKILVIGALIPLLERQTLADRLSGLNAGAVFFDLDPVVARDGVTDKDRAESVAKARQMLPILAERSRKATQDQDWKRRNVITFSSQMYLALLAEFGGVEDVAFLLASSFEVPGAAVRAAASIERRLGLLEDGMVVGKAREELTADPTSLAAFYPAYTLAGAGHAAGFEMAVRIDEVRSDKRRAEGKFPNSKFAAEIAAGPPEIALEAQRVFLRDIHASIGAALASGELNQIDELRYSYKQIREALSVVAVYGNAADRKLLSIPVLQDGFFLALAPVVADPGKLIKLSMTFDDTLMEGRFKSHPTLMRPFLCPAFELRGSTEIAAIKRSAADALVEAHFRLKGARPPETSKAFEASAVEAAEIVAQQSASCEADAGVNAMDFNWTEPQEDASITKRNLDYPWWRRPSLAMLAAEEFSSGNATKHFRFLTQFDHDWVMAQFKNGLDPDFRDAFERYHRLLSGAWLPSVKSQAAFGAERRSFRLRFDGPYGPVPLLGHLDIIPLVEGDDLVIAMRIAATYDLRSSSFLGRVHAQFVDPYAADHFRKTIESVKLQQNGASAEASFEQSTQDGVHYFKVPYNGSFTQSYLRIGMVFSDGEREHRWPVDIALHYSAADFRNRLASTSALIAQ